MKSSAPISISSWRFSSIALAVTAMILGSLPPAMARIRRIASWPSITGMRKSIRIRWGRHCFKLLDGFRSVGRQPDLESDRGQKLGQQLAVILDVVGDQHAARRLPGLEPQDVPRLVFRLNRLGLALLQRQLDDENAAFANLAVAP